MAWPCFPFSPGSRDKTARSRRARRAQRLGRRGERVAARWLRRRGYRLHARNLQTPRGEIDLLAEEAGQIVLVEVKATRGPAGVPLARRYGRGQRARQRAAARWLARQRVFRNATFRHDLVMVTFDGWHSLVTIRRDILRSRRC